MKTSTKSIIVAGIVLTVAAAGYLLHKHSEIQPPNTGITNDAYLKELDVNRQDLVHYLSGRDVSPSNLYRAVIQLAEVKEPVALKSALKMKDDSDRYLREGAAQALGYFDSEVAQTALKSLLEDKEQSVRTFAVQGLGRSSNPVSKGEIEALLKRTALSDSEQVAVRESYYRTSKEESEKQRAITSLALLATHAPSDSLQALAALKMMEIAPEEDETGKVIRKKIEAAQDVKVIGSGIRFLSSRQDPWIKTRLAELAKHKDPLVRKAVVQSLHRICPADRWQILNSMIENETDVSVIDVAIEEPLVMPDPQAEAFLENALKSPAVKTHAEAKSKNILEKLRSEKLPNPCLGQ